MPTSVTFASASSGCAEAVGTVTCTLPALSASATRQLTVTVDVISTTTGLITNMAEVGSDIIDPNTGNNFDSEDTTVLPIADLAVSKTVDKMTPGEAFTVTYSITVTNNGPQNATGVVIRDTLPGGITYVTDDSGGAYNSGSGLWTIGALANGSSATLAITATVDLPTRLLLTLPTKSTQIPLTTRTARQLWWSPLFQLAT
jgi:uncharacterized repeat protein (TIGR01451 family)